MMHCTMLMTLIENLQCLFARVNLLNRLFWRCSIGVKLQLLCVFL